MEAFRKTQETRLSFTTRPRGITLWEDVVHPRHTFAPGPIYRPQTDSTLHGKLGDSATFKYGRAPQRYAAGLSSSEA